jgi:hypothetical protein
MPFDAVEVAQVILGGALPARPRKRDAKPPRLSVSRDAEHGELLAPKDRHTVSMAWLGRQAIVEFAAVPGRVGELPLRLTRRGQG